MLKIGPKPSLRKLNISSPVMQNQKGEANTSFTSSSEKAVIAIPRSSTDSPIVLITKFDFKAEHKNEITVGVGEALKLVERKGNGWILVKPIGRLGEAGLIPASYVRIVKMDKENQDPEQDEMWLSRTQSKESSRTTCLSSKHSSNTKIPTPDTHTSDDTDDNYFSFLSSVSSSTSLSAKNSTNPSPKSSVSISVGEPRVATPVEGRVINADICNGRYWYRVDITMNDGKKRHLCRYYQDFYKLHCAALDYLSRTKEEDVVSLLPALPDPIARPDLHTLESILLQRCQSLNIYIFKLVQNKHMLDYGKVLNDWTSPRLGDIELSSDLQLSSEAIQDMLSPIPTKANASSRLGQIAKPQIAKPVLTVKTSVTPPLPAPAQSNFSFYKDRTGSVSSTISQSSATSPRIWPSPIMVSQPTFRSERTSSTPTIHEGHEFDDWLTSPVEPLLIPRRRNFSNPSSPGISQRPVDIKAKVYHNDDIFALRLKFGCRLADVKSSIARRLECSVEKLELYYKDLVQNVFIAMDDDNDLDIAMTQEKLFVEIKLI
jgi:hypothetical protein